MYKAIRGGATIYVSSYSGCASSRFALYDAYSNPAIVLSVISFSAISFSVTYFFLSSGLPSA